MNQNMTKRLERLEGSRSGGKLALVEPLGNGLYKWAGHEGEYTMEQVSAQLAPDARIIIWDIPWRPKDGEPTEAHHPA